MAGGDPNLQHAKGVAINRKTLGWNAAAATFAYGYGTLATLGYKFVGQDQLIGGTWPGVSIHCVHTALTILACNSWCTFTCRQ